jgi:hypothetical protein
MLQIGGVKYTLFSGVGFVYPLVSAYYIMEDYIAAVLV